VFILRTHSIQIFFFVAFPFSSEYYLILSRLRLSLFISISQPFSIPPALSICRSLCVWWSVSRKTYEVEIMGDESDVWRSLGRFFDRSVSSCMSIQVKLLNTRTCTHFPVLLFCSVLTHIMYSHDRPSLQWPRQ